jgi:hypothetical protein
MKKTLLFLALLPSILFAQIGQIQTHEKPYEFFYNGEVYRKVADDTYYLQIRSDNQFEDKAAVLTLGTGATEAMTSLGNLFALFEKDDSDFELQGYRFGLRRNGIFAYKTGPLEYSAGDFMLRKYVLPRVMADLMEKKNMPIGDVRVVYSDKYAAYIYYDTYGFYPMEQTFLALRFYVNGCTLGCCESIRRRSKLRAFPIRYGDFGSPSSGFYHQAIPLHPSNG